MDDGLVTCPSCNQRTAPGPQCQWCDRPLTVEPVREAAAEEGPARMGGCLKAFLIALAIVLIGVGICFASLSNLSY